MNATVLCNNLTHPVMPWLERWTDEQHGRGHQVTLCTDRQQLTGGDVLFLVSCGQIIRDAERQRFRAVLVLHASDLPVGRGWSPHIWQIVGGATRVTVSMIEAREPVDTGDIWLQRHFDLEGHELLDEINERLFEAELALMTQTVDEFDTIRPRAQVGAPGPHLRRRTPDDSRLDANKTIAEQFDLLRVVDNSRYPAFFEHRGAKYLLKIEKVKS